MRLSPDIFPNFTPSFRRLISTATSLPKNLGIPLKLIKASLRLRDSLRKKRIPEYFRLSRRLIITLILLSFHFTSFNHPSPNLPLLLWCLFPQHKLNRLPLLPSFKLRRYPLRSLPQLSTRLKPHKRLRMDFFTLVSPSIKLIPAPSIELIINPSLFCLIHL